MKVYRDLNELPHFRNAVLTIGSFDGLHFGHRKILNKVKDLALATGGESVVITFHPHPRQIVYPKDDTLRLLTTTEEKIALFEQTGIDNLVVVPFTFEFSQMSADEYIQRFLVGKFHPRYIVIGYDHRFGLNRRGDINYLKWHEKALNYKVVEISKEEIDDLEVSSTRIRQHVEKSEMVSAGKLMHHFFTLTGKVVRGQQIGASIGFPTANLFIENKVKLIPPDGIYAAYVLHDGMRHRAMLYIGNRPTIGGNLKRTIEVHIFDFSQTIYEREIQVELANFIRPDEKQQDLNALKTRLAEDKTAAERLLDQADALLNHWHNLSKPSVDVVILNYNGRQYLEKYLPGVLKTNYGNFRVVVADNASKDDSVAYLRQAFPQVQIIELKQNYGFAKGYNLALAELEPDYFVLLNSDVLTPENWLEPLVELMEKDKTVAAVQPKIRALNQPDHFEYAGAAGGWIDFLGYPFCRGRIFAHTEKDLGQYDSTAEVFWATGACMAIRAPLFRGFGGFDDEFFAHLEEIDLCWRLKRAGYKIMATHRSVVYHLGGGTLAYHSPYKTYLNFRNSYFTLLKNEGIFKLAVLLPVRFLMDTVAALSFLMQAKFLHAQAVIGALLTVFIALITFIKKRLDIELLLDRVRISPQENRQGVLPRSIVFEYFVLQKKFFDRL